MQGEPASPPPPSVPSRRETSWSRSAYTPQSLPPPPPDDSGREYESEVEYDGYDSWRSEEQYEEEGGDEREAEVENPPLSKAEIDRLIQAAVAREVASAVPPVPAEEVL